MIETIIIVGAGLAGATAARALRAGGYEGKIHLLGEEGRYPYDRPSLSKTVLLGDGETPPLLMEPSWYHEANIDLCLDDAVESIDRERRMVMLRSGAVLKFDRLIFATGMRPRKLPFPGADLRGVYYLRDYADCESLRKAFSEARSLVIVGGGLIGCEVATAARKAGLQVTILDCADELLVRVLGDKVGGWCRQQLLDLGVRIELNARLERMVGDQTVLGVVCSDGRDIEADIVLVSIGGEPADALLKAAGIDCENGVLVDACGQSSSAEIYAIGDVAAWPIKGGGRRSLETYINSQQQAETAVAALLGHCRPAPQIATSWTEIAGHRIQMIGDMNGPGEFVLRGDLSSGQPALLFRIHEEKLVAAVSIDALKDFSIVTRLVSSDLSVPSRLLSDTSFALRELLKKSTRAETAA